MKRAKLNSSSVVVFGGRKFVSQKFFNLFMEQISRDLKNLRFPPNICEIVTGDCKTGADRMARFWARKHKIPLVVYYADWDKHGKAAGPMRNQEMSDHMPTIGVAFEGGKGTRDMTARLVQKGIIYIRAERNLEPHLLRMKCYEANDTLRNSEKSRSRSSV